jgi:hypothetical protein
VKPIILSTALHGLYTLDSRDRTQELKKIVRDTRFSQRSIDIHLKHQAYVSMLCEELEYLGFKVNTEYGVDEEVLSRLLRDNGLVLRSEWAQVGFTCFFALNAYRSSVFFIFLHVSSVSANAIRFLYTLLHFY